MTPRFALVLSAFAIAGAAHATKPLPVEKLPSGVTVTHLTPTAADAKKPVASDQVRVHYRGTLENGTEFDSSYKRGQPAVFGLGQVIPCWTQGLQTMTVGQKARLECPATTAYGSRGVPGVIPANATLTFEVELLGIGR